MVTEREPCVSSTWLAPAGKTVTRSSLTTLGRGARGPPVLSRALLRVSVTTWSSGLCEQCPLRAGQLSDPQIQLCPCRREAFGDGGGTPIPQFLCVLRITFSSAPSPGLTQDPHVCPAGQRAPSSPGWGREAETHADFGMTDRCRLQGRSPPSAQVPPSLCLPRADGEERLGHTGHRAHCTTPSPRATPVQGEGRGPSPGP